MKYFLYDSGFENGEPLLLDVKLPKGQVLPPAAVYKLYEVRLLHCLSPLWIHSLPLQTGDITCLNEQELLKPIHAEVARVDEALKKELKKAADEFSERLHKAGLRETSRPAIVGAIITALWYEKQDSQRSLDPSHFVEDITKFCERAFADAGKEDLGKILVHELVELGKRPGGKEAATSIYNRLKQLCPDQLDADFIGLLYQNFFTYTGARRRQCGGGMGGAALSPSLHSCLPSPSGANKQGQYFTPHWVVRIVLSCLCCGIFLVFPLTVATPPPYRLDRLHGPHRASEDGLQGAGPLLRHRRPAPVGGARSAALVCRRGRVAAELEGHNRRLQGPAVRL